MKQECVDAVRKAAGRDITQVEKKDIEQRIRQAKTELARQDQAAFMAMTPAEQLQAAGKVISDQLKVASSKKKVQVASAIMAHDRIERSMNAKIEAGMAPLKALFREVGTLTDGLSRGISMESRINGIKAFYIKQMLGALKSTDRRWLGLLDNPVGTRAFTKALFSEDLSAFDPEVARVAKEGAAQWKSVTEAMRQRFNSLGGNIGKLENWIYAQSHSQLRIAKAGAEKWVNDITPLLDRRQYVNEDGTRMSDDQLNSALQEVHTTISTGGANKMEPGRFKGRGMLANQNANERWLHFKDADSMLSYNQAYGGRSVYDTLVGHVGNLSGDIGTIEHFGANPDLQFKYWIDKSLQKEILDNPVNEKQLRADAQQLQAFYDYTQGRSKPIVNRAVARVFDTARAYISATALPLAAPFTALNHLSTSAMTSSYLGIGGFQTFRNTLKAANIFDRTEEHQAQRLGLSLETATGSVNKWAGDYLGAAFTKNLSNASVRASGLTSILEGMRRAFGVTMYGSIGRTVRDVENLESVTGKSRAMLDAKGITDRDFQVWKKANLEDWGGGNNTMLVPENIAAIPDEQIAPLNEKAYQAIEDARAAKIGNLTRPDSIESWNNHFDTQIANLASQTRLEAITKLMAMVDEESHNAVITPTAGEHFKSTGGSQPGTVMGELAKSFYMFKSIPQAQIVRNFNRAMTLPTGAGKAGYLAAYVAATTAISSLVIQMKELAAGRDPENMAAPKFWMDALLKGGSLGMYSDFLFNTEGGQSSILDRAAGPLFQRGKDIYDLTIGNIEKAAQGKQTTVGKDLFKVTKENIPLVRNIYTKVILDRLIFNDLQEQISPGYMNAVENRARQNQQQYFYRPQELLPSRAPDLTKAIQ